MNMTPTVSSNVTEFALGTSLMCQLNVNDMHYLIVDFLALMTLSSFFLAFAFYALAFFQREVVFLMVGIGINVNFLVNYILRVGLVRQETPLEGCGAKFGMPSYLAQNTAFVLVFVLSLPWFFKIRPHYPFIAIMTFIHLSTVWVGIQFHYNYQSQLLVGTLLGSLLAILWQFLTMFFVKERIKRALNTDFNKNYCSYFDSLRIYE
jgi:hypothetical protein